MSDLPTITFSPESTVHVLPPSSLVHTENLSNECSTFISQCADFKVKTGELVSVLGRHGDTIERHKLAAIGQRNRVSSEVEDRQRQVSALQAAISEKRAELERVGVKRSSLERVEAEQVALIERLQNQ
jgi:intraflagellar transport protein 20